MRVCLDFLLTIFFKVYLLIYYWISCNVDGEFSIDLVFICFSFLFSKLSIFPSTSDPVWLGYNLSVTSCSLGLSSETWLSWSLSQELRAHSVAILSLVSSVLLGCWRVIQFSADFLSSFFLTFILNGFVDIFEHITINILIWGEFPQGLLC